jgi:hypothetical protein
MIAFHSHCQVICFSCDADLIQQPKQEKDVYAKYCPRCRLWTYYVLDPHPKYPTEAQWIKDGGWSGKR